MLPSLISLASFPLLRKYDQQILKKILMIQSEDERYIELIKALVDYYVSQRECLILVAISMKGTPPILTLTHFTDDIENQSAFTIAREHDTTGARTIGSNFIYAQC